jgi:hypothetical protein
MNRFFRIKISTALALRVAVGLIALAWVQAAQAQDFGDEPGDESLSDIASDAEREADDAQQSPPPQKRNWNDVSEEPRREEVAPPPVRAPGLSDHASVVGHAGVGFFGVVYLPMTTGVLDETTGAYVPSYTGEVAAPTVGLRYWASDLVGLEFALGIGVSTGIFEQEIGGATLVNDPPAYGGGVLHAGLPLAVGDSQHFVFEVIPEIDVGFGAGTIFGDVASADRDLRGFLVQVGARAGAEIHFGFIDVPQLALQGTVGVHLRSEHRYSDGPGNDSTTSASLKVGTSVEQNPWDFFITNVNAIYYFP